MKTLRLTLAIALASIAGCADFQIKGRIETSRGSIESDGKTITLILPADGGFKK